MSVDLLLSKVSTVINISSDRRIAQKNIRKSIRLLLRLDYKIKKKMQSINFVNPNEKKLLQSQWSIYVDYYFNNYGSNWDLFYHPKDNNLPIKGWFHKCPFCKTITGNKFFIKQLEEKKIYLVMCHTCINKYKNNLLKSHEMKLYLYNLNFIHKYVKKLNI